MKRNNGLANLKRGGREKNASIKKPPATQKTSSIRVPERAFCDSRLMEDTNTPATSETNSALSSASDVFQNARPLTPPINSVIPTTGNAASSVYKPRKEAAS